MAESLMARLRLGADSSIATTVVLADPSDYTIRAIEFKMADNSVDDLDTRVFSRRTGKKPPKVKVFKVSRSTLMEASDKLRAQFKPDGHFIENTRNSYDLKTLSVDAMEVWLRIAHEKSISETLAFPAMVVWYVISEGEYHGFEVESAYKWYKAWLVKNGEKLPWEQWLYPCFKFDYAHGFAKATKGMVYGRTGHLMEENPTPVARLRLPVNAIRQIRAAKGSLRNLIYRRLFDIEDTLIEKDCKCWKEALANYVVDLKKTGAWPSEVHGQTLPVGKILEMLMTFEYTKPNDACIHCSADLTGNVKVLCTGAAADFDGLCIDCMYLSETNTDREDADYWEHDIEQEWDTDCRIRHRKSTWYFSYMGRDEDMKAHQNRKYQHLLSHDPIYGDWGF